MKVLFLDTVHPILKERLQAAGFICDENYTSDKQEIAQIISAYDGLVIRSRFRIDKDFLEQATRLKFIARSGAGMENIDLDYAEKKGIKCFNSPEGNRDAVAEQAVGMLLMLMNNLLRSDKEVRQARWNREKNRGYEICGKTVGIIGYGFMGTAFAQRLSGFGCKVLAYDKYKKDFGNDVVREVSLQQIFDEADILSIHLHYTEETHYYVDSTFLSKFKKSIWLINTARGMHVNTADLLKHIDNGKVRGACLDVLEYEKSSFENLSQSELPDTFKQLVACDKVVLSPHIAGWTFESYEKLSAVLADKILAVFS